VTCGVYGEIAVDGRHVIVVAAGQDWEVNRAAAAIRAMTAPFSKTRPPGALAGPLTWAIVTQLALTFNGGSLGQWAPGPRLQDWVLAEFTQRTALPALAANPQQPALVDEPAAADVLPANAPQHAAHPVPPAFVNEPAANVQQPAITPVTAANRDQPAIIPVPAAHAQQPATAPVLVPRHYQLEGARVIATTGKALIFDEAGCGKTVTTILGLLERQRLGHAIFPLVILVPSWDVGEVWARHARDWAPNWPPPVMHGGKNRQPRPDGIMITTYATARLDAASAGGPLVTLRARAVVCDEVHLTRNHASLLSQAVRRIAEHAQTFVGLSGTPVTRDTGDVYPALAAMDPASWPSRDAFIKRYCFTVDDGYQRKVEGLAPLAEPEFRAVLLGQYRRVAKADVLSQLPPKVYSVRTVAIPAPWRAAYTGMANDMLAQLPEDGGDLPVMSTLAQLTRLSQLASSACDVTVRTELNELGMEVKRYDVTLKAPSWKADCLLEILAERRGQQVAVFAVSKQLIDIAGAACKDAGYRCGYITGGQGKAARRNDIDAFQAGQLDVILATSGAGSLGITLTAASTVVMLQRSWQLDQALQPEDRAHRIGNENCCIEVIDIIAKSTVDERVRTVLRGKGGQLSELVRDPRVVRELMGGLR
jgi:SNF2 family DNA or RNA helicase